MNPPNLQPPQAPIKKKRVRHPKARAVCLTCKTEFLYHISAKKGRFCSYECYWKDLKTNGLMVKGIVRHTGPAWNKGKKGCYTPEQLKRMATAQRGKKHSAETRRKIGVASKGNKHRLGQTWKQTPEWTEKIRRKLLGKPQPHSRGANSNFWKGGISAETRTERMNFMHSLEYKSWRRAVFERDDFTCQECGTRGCVLQADHVRAYILFPELRLALDNGRSLCMPCHRVKTKEDWVLMRGDARPVITIMRSVWSSLRGVCYNRDRHSP